MESAAAATGIGVPPAPGQDLLFPPLLDKRLRARDQGQAIQEDRPLPEWHSGLEGDLQWRLTSYKWNRSLGKFRLHSRRPTWLAIGNYSIRTSRGEHRTI